MLKAWFKARLDNPFPTPAEKRALVLATGMTMNQCDHWFSNTRKLWWWEHPSNPVLNEWRALGRPPAKGGAPKPGKGRAAAPPSAKPLSEAAAALSMVSTSAGPARPARGASSSQDQERGPAAAEGPVARGRKRGPGQGAVKAEPAEALSDPDYDPDEEAPSKRRKR